jgi:hypothetical protein
MAALWKNTWDRRFHVYTFQTWILWHFSCLNCCNVFQTGLATSTFVLPFMQSLQWPEKASNSRLCSFFAQTPLLGIKSSLTIATGHRGDNPALLPFYPCRDPPTSASLMPHRLSFTSPNTTDQMFYLCVFSLSCGLLVPAS